MEIKTEMARFAVYTEEGELVGRYKTKEEAEKAAGALQEVEQEETFDGVQEETHKKEESEEEFEPLFKAEKDC